MLEAEEQRVDRSRRRVERDNLMFEKMEILASELEGGAKDLMLDDIEHMRSEVESGDDAAKERASIELDRGTLFRCIVSRLYF